MTGVRSRRRKREDAKGFGHESLLLALSSEKCGGAFGSWSEERATTRPLLGSTKTHPTCSPVDIAASMARRI